MITAPEIHTDLLWDLSFLFIGLAVVYFIFIFFYRNRLSKGSWQVKERKKELSPMISEFLFYEEDASKDEKSNYVKLKIEIRQLLKDDFNRKVLSEVLLDLRKDVAGDTQKRLFKLYQDLGLHDDDFKRLKSWRWETVSKSILNLTQMQVAEAYSFVTKFINDKRHTIRKQAEIAIVTLKPEGINYFLDTTKYKISEWQQLKLMDVLRNEANYQPPRFKAWLTSTNRHVVLFALRLIKYYNQNDADAALIELVKHKNNQIKEEAIQCIKEFHIEEALPTLKLVFWKCTTNVKISILNAIGVLGSKQDLEFLELIEKKEANFSVRSKAHASINAIVPDSIMPSKGVVNSSKYTIPEDIKIEVEEDELEEIYIGSNSEIESSNEIIEQVDEIVVDAEQEREEETTLDWNLSNKTIDKQEEIIDNEVDTNAMEENQESLSQENTESFSNATTSQENETLSFDFLPFVVEENLETEKIDTEKDANNDLNDIEVDFEIVAFEKEEEPAGRKEHSLEITAEEIAFLPIVTELIEESYEVSKIKDKSAHIAILNEIEVLFEEVQNMLQSPEMGLSSEYSEYSKPEILDFEVTYDVILSKSMTSLEKDTETPEPDPYFLSTSSEHPQEDTMDSKSNVNPKPLQPYDDMETQNEQKFKKIIQDLIEFNENQQPEKNRTEFQNGPLLEFGDEFVDTSKASKAESETNEKSETDSQAEVKETIQDEPTGAKLTIPKAILNEDSIEDIVAYKENTEESRMQLLDDLEEMGDERELPLLNELLVNEKYVTVKDRVKKLIDKFSEGEERAKADTLLKPFNVFEDLFRTCDTEAKLILMNEIVAVGDASDIDFLEGLLENEDKRLSNKAAQVLEELKAILSIPVEKITTEVDSEQRTTSKTGILEEKQSVEYNSIMEELQIQPPKSSEIFDLTFELTEPEEEKTKTNLSKKSGNQESIFGQICAFSNKIIDKLNG